MKSAFCDARQLCRSYLSGGVEQKVVRCVDLSVQPGELTLLMGPSGSGKTTMLSMLAGLLKPSAGEVDLLGEAIHGASERTLTRLRRAGVGFVFQQPNLFPALSALENVAQVLMLKGLTRPRALERAASALEGVGLKDRMTHRPDELSGGQKQRVAVARALAPGPRILFGDEVTAALDSQSAFGVMQLLRAFVTPSTAALLVTHDLRLTQFADRVLSMEDGVIVSDTRSVARNTQAWGAQP